MEKKRFRRPWHCMKKALFSRSFGVGLMLFVLGLTSLLMGNIASDLHWSQFRRRIQPKVKCKIEPLNF